MKTNFIFILFLISHISSAQTTGANFDTIDSLIETTPQIILCKKNGKDDIRFFARTPEKYSNYKQELMAQADSAFTFNVKSHFFCDVTVEVNCTGKAGNYHFAIEPRNFKPEDFEYFKQLIALVNKLREYSFKPAYYLGQNVNSKLHFRLAAKGGKLVMQ